MRAWLYRLLKVPPEPAPPPGSRETALVFRAARNFYRLLLLRWGIKQVSAVVGIVVSLGLLANFSESWSPQARFWVRTAEWIGIASFVVQIPFTYLLTRLDYELRWYIVTDRSLRIRSGLFHVREMTMTFVNIQHLAVHQGPLQRLLGLYDLNVRTAGGGGAESDPSHQSTQSGATHIGHFHGVDNAPAIRDLILERMKQVRDAGLGDTDDQEAQPALARHEPAVSLTAFHDALGELRLETQRLRQTLAEMGRGG